MVRCSPTGSFLVTSDDCGTLKVWSFDDFSLIYQLSCSSTVNDLAVNPDGKRIYDLRGSSCNIWEPNSLIRLAEPDERASDTSSTSASSTQLSHVSEAFAETAELVEALAVGERTSVYCTGHPDGAVRIFDKAGKMLHALSPTTVAVSHVIWSDDERYLAVSDVRTRVSIHSFSSTTSSPTIVFEDRLGEPVQQILFNKSANLLLAVHHDLLRVWSVEKEPIITMRELPKKTLSMDQPSLQRRFAGRAWTG
jgi:WD40 repeat protein